MEGTKQEDEMLIGERYRKAAQDEVRIMMANEQGFVQKQKNTALARGNWTKAIECDAKLDLLRLLESKLT